MHLDKDYHLLILNLFSHNLQLFQLSSVQATVDAREPIRNLLHKVHEGARIVFQIVIDILLAWIRRLVVVVGGRWFHVLCKKKWLQNQFYILD